MLFFNPNGPGGGPGHQQAILDAQSRPLLIYLYEIAPWDARFAVPTAVIFLPGAALGSAWALLLGPVVADSLVPRLATSLTNGGVLASAVAAPATGQLP